MDYFYYMFNLILQSAKFNKSENLICLITQTDSEYFEINTRRGQLFSDKEGRL